MSQDAPRTAGEMLARGREFLVRKGCTEARLEAELLLAHALGLTRLQLYLALDRPVTDAEIARARESLVRRGKREPVAYITGKREFYGREFAVDARVLVPRPETELIVDLVRAFAQARDDAAPLRVGDVGTGSGCIAITLALWLKQAQVHASDVSAAALVVAKANAASLGARVEFHEGDGLAPLAPLAPFDVLISNPPYIDPDQAQTLAPEVRDHEPHLALFAPRGDRDAWARRWMDQAGALLAPGGRVWIELGADQAESVKALAAARGWRAATHRDLAGHERVLELAR